MVGLSRGKPIVNQGRSILTMRGNLLPVLKKLIVYWWSSAMHEKKR